MSPAQRWTSLCQAVEAAQSASVQMARGQSEAAEFLAGEGHDVACDQILLLIMAPEARVMRDQVKEFLDCTYGGQR